MKVRLPLLYLASFARQMYMPLKVRVRQWGALPAPRGATLLITNHQHVDEGEIVFTRTYLKHPQLPIVAVNSRRTFENGFFAARLPWTAPLTRNFNPTGLWLQFGLLPIENHLHSRALISLAADVRAVHGDLPLEALLPEDDLAALKLNGRRLSELWSPDCFLLAQEPVKVSHLKQPFRREALEHFRTTLAADVAQVIERLQRGATFYFTPEGDFSRDGRMRPMRNGLTDAVLPLADPWLCAIAYDPFRGRRLSMLYRVVQPADRDDLGTSLAAARAVTASALLATFLSTAAGPFEARAARENVRAQIAALPENVFLDPEVRRNPDGAVTEALTVLVARGTLAAEGTRYRLTGSRGDERFPHVTDMVAFQTNMLEETIAAAKRLT